MQSVSWVPSVHVSLELRLDCFITSVKPDPSSNPDQPGVCVPPRLLVLSSQAEWFRRRGVAPETAVHADRIVVDPSPFC